MIEWLASTPLSTLIRQHDLLYPAINAIHILGIASLFGSILIFDLRLIGRLKSVPLDFVYGLCVPIAKMGFGIAAVTGVLLFISNPVELWNISFQIKLCLIALALLNVAFYSRSRQPVHGWISIMLWVGVIIAGRWIAYV